MVRVGHPVAVIAEDAEDGHRRGAEDGCEQHDQGQDAHRVSLLLHNEAELNREDADDPEEHEDEADREQRLRRDEEGRLKNWREMLVILVEQPFAASKLSFVEIIGILEALEASLPEAQIVEVGFAVASVVS